jgi:endonuclease YncB( thermonuclease family)
MGAKHLGGGAAGFGVSWPGLLIGSVVILIIGMIVDGALLKSAPDIKKVDARVTGAPTPSTRLPKKEPERLSGLPNGPDATNPMILEPPHEVVDGLTLVFGLNRVRIVSLEGPSGDAACFDGENSLWACGLRARVALHNMTRRQQLTCLPVSSSPQGLIAATCSAGGVDVGRMLVSQGWARPEQPGTVDYTREIQAAKQQKLGLWDGGWRIRDIPADSSRGQPPNAPSMPKITPIG